MNEQELQELEALCKAATPGPWFYDDTSIGCAVGWVGGVTHQQKADGEFAGLDDDGQFIAASRSAIPALIAEVRRLRAGWDAALADLDILDDLIPTDIAEVLDE